MAAALLVVPAIAAAWMWVAPRGRLAALRQLLAGGAAMVVVGGAWPLLMALTPAVRPAVGVGHERQQHLVPDPRLQRARATLRPERWTGRRDRRPGRRRLAAGVRRRPGRPAAAEPEPRRTGRLAARLRARGGRRDRGRHPAAARRRRARGWIIAVGGASSPSRWPSARPRGSSTPTTPPSSRRSRRCWPAPAWHVMLSGGRLARVVGPAAVVAGVITELAVIHQYPGELGWAPPLLIAGGGAAAVVLALGSGVRKQSRGRGGRGDGAAPAGPGAPGRCRPSGTPPAAPSRPEGRRAPPWAAAVRAGPAAPGAAGWRRPAGWRVRRASGGRRGGGRAGGRRDARPGRRPDGRRRRCRQRAAAACSAATASR